MQANELHPGDRIATLSGEWVRVEEVYDTGEWAVVYNLRIADHHTYFVGNEEWGFAVWAHNAYAIVHQYVAQGIAVGHWSVDVFDDNGKIFHTHQLGAPGSLTTPVVDATLRPPSGAQLAEGRIDIPNGVAAITYETEQMEAGGRNPYDLYTQSCVSYVCEVLAAGGVTVPAPQGPPNGSVQLKFLLRIVKTNP